MDRSKALAIYKKVMASNDNISIKCVDVSEVIDTHGLAPIYELHIKHENSETLREVIKTIRVEDIIITETSDGIYVV